MVSRNISEFQVQHYMHVCCRTVSRASFDVVHTINTLVAIFAYLPYLCLQMLLRPFAMHA